MKRVCTTTAVQYYPLTHSYSQLYICMSDAYNTVGTSLCVLPGLSPKLVTNNFSSACKYMYTDQLQLPWMIVKFIQIINLKCL